MEGEITVDDPRAADVRALLERHLAFTAEHSPPEDVHALDVEALVDPAITFVSYREAGEVPADAPAQVPAAVGAGGDEEART